MAKAKTKAVVMVADGTGGLVQVEDQRFVAAGWPINFEVPTEQADNWLTYLTAECGKRGWSGGGISQMEAKENSGSITFNDRTGQQRLEVVWERKRGGPIKVRARPVGTPSLPLDEANELFKQVNARSAAGETAQFSRRGTCTTKGCLGAASCGWTRHSG